MKILEENNVSFEIVLYLKTPPTSSELKTLGEKMGLRPKEFIRKKETEFKEQELSKFLEDDDALFESMSKYPKLIERPIAVNKNKAVLCRPPVRILDII